jgi:hypothetical protein
MDGAAGICFGKSLRKTGPESGIFTTSGLRQAEDIRHLRQRDK